MIACRGTERSLYRLRAQFSRLGLCRGALPQRKLLTLCALLRYPRSRPEGRNSGCRSKWGYPQCENSTMQGSIWELFSLIAYQWVSLFAVGLFAWWSYFRSLPHHCPSRSDPDGGTSSVVLLRTPYPVLRIHTSTDYSVHTLHRCRTLRVSGKKTLLTYGVGSTDFSVPTICLRRHSPACTCVPNLAAFLRRWSHAFF